MSTPVVPGTAVSPPGYLWRWVWPESRAVAWLLASSAGLVGAAAFSVVGMLAGNDFVARVGGLLLLVAATTGVIYLVTRIEDRPWVRQGDEASTFVLRYLPIRVAPVLAALTALAIAALWIGVLERALEPMFFGIALLVAVLVLACLGIRYRRTARLCLSPHTIRVTTRNFDWEFPWEAVDFAAGFDAKGTETIAIRCPRTAVTTRPTRGKTPTHLRPPEDSPDGPWKLAPIMWGVSPNSLFSTLEHLRTDPDLRAELTHAQLTAMLTPPPWQTRRPLDIDPL
ncbi:hypothetical protein [Nocardia sp. NPDC050793]|uniref:hypothetical protein n=1 Tax=Nocardia sp. NPDC050793 TaxID=3155159 RepID=UPI0033D8DE83